MCLITNRKKPYIAEEDLKVYKVLTEMIGANGAPYYVTTFMGTTVNLNSLLEAERDDRQATVTDTVINHTRMFSIGKGYIHSVARGVIDSLFHIKYEAVIPKGTRYYIDINMYDICSEKLFITDRKVCTTIGLPRAEWKKIVKPIMDRIDREKISLGWLYREDGSFFEPLEYEYRIPSDIIGIVVDVDDEGYIIMKTDFGEARGYLRKIPVTCTQYGLEWSLPTKEMLLNVVGTNIDTFNFLFKNMMKPTIESFDFIFYEGGRYGHLRKGPLLEPAIIIPYTIARFTKVKR